MTRLQQLPAALQHSLEQRSTLKVIAGLMNFDAASVERVARAAGHGGADLIDVACDAELVKLAIEASSGVPVCVSSVEPEQFPAAVSAGAVMVEIGNYDAFYPHGRIFGAERTRPRVALGAEHSETGEEQCSRQRQPPSKRCVHSDSKPK